MRMTGWADTKGRSNLWIRDAETKEIRSTGGRFFPKDQSQHSPGIKTIFSCDFVCMFLFQFIKDRFSGEFPIKPVNGRSLALI